MTKLLFDHNAKVGGSTVFRHIQRAYPEKVFFINGYQPWHSIEHCPRDMDCVAGHEAFFLIPILQPEKTATVIRRPVQRVMSLYRFFKQEGIIDPSATVEGFLDSIPTASNFYAKKYSCLPQNVFQRCPKMAVERAVIEILEFDVVGFSHKMNQFLAEMEFPPIEEDFRANVTRHQEEISDEDRDRIIAANRLDIEIYQQVAKARGGE